jgi:hypothetical protein
MEKKSVCILSKTFFMKKLFFYLPILALAALISTNSYSQKKPPPPPPPKVSMSKVKPENPSRTFYKRNPSVEDISWTTNNKVVIRLKTGNKEDYDLDNPQEMKTFQEKYGIPPPPPPPPPPLPKN